MTITRKIRKLNGEEASKGLYKPLGRALVRGVLLYKNFFNCKTSSMHSFLSNLILFNNIYSNEVDVEEILSYLSNEGYLLETENLSGSKPGDILLKPRDSKEGLVASSILFEKAKHKFVEELITFLKKNNMRILPVIFQGNLFCQVPREEKKSFEELISNFYLMKTSLFSLKISPKARIAWSDLQSSYEIHTIIPLVP